MRHRHRPALSSAIAIAVALLVAGLPASAQELTGALKKIKETGVISIGYAEARPPFSFVDSRKNVAGYAIDICNDVIGAVRTELNRPDLRVQMLPIKADDAISFVRSGAIDLHCGPVTNTSQHKAQVDFGMTYYVLQYRYASKEWAHMMEIEDMGGKSIATMYGSAAMRALEGLDATRGLAARILPANTNEQAWAMFDRGDADAVAMDDVSLAQFVARAKEMVMTSSATLGVEPYSLVFARGDAPFRSLVLEAMTRFFRSGRVQPAYRKWFQTVNAPSSAINLGPGVSSALEKVLRNPTDSPDPAFYQ